MLKIIIKQTLFFISLLVMTCYNASYCNAQELAQIINLQDFNQFKWKGSGDYTADYNLCVFSDTGRYSVNIQGSENGFFLTDRDIKIPFTVKWNDLPTSNNSKVILHNITLPNQTGAKTYADDCLTENSANISITFKESDLQNASAGNYSGYLTIIIEAEI